MNVGKLLSLQFYADEPFLLAAGGDKGVVAIWESDELVNIRDRFMSRVVMKASDYAFGEIGGGGGAASTAADEEIEMVSASGEVNMEDLDEAAGEERERRKKDKKKGKKKGKGKK